MIRGSTHNLMTFRKCHTCEVYGLYGLDKIRPLHLEPIQQLTYEAHDVKLRGNREQSYRQEFVLMRNY